MTVQPSASLPHQLRKLLLVPVPGLVLATFFALCLLWNLAPLEQCISAAPPISSNISSSSSSSSSLLLEEQPSYNELVEKKEAIMEELRNFSMSSLLSKQNQSSCSGKQIYIYKLPSKFNEDILSGCDTFLPWFSMCEYFTNFAMGAPVLTSSSSSSRGIRSSSQVLVPAGRWFQTNQYALDVLFHQKLLRYPCLTDSPDEAVLFYVPYYAGLDVLRYHYADVSLEKKNELGVQLIEWLEQHGSWKRNQGRDHILVLGKITWDFRRNNVTLWGNTLLKMPEYANLMKLLIERDPWELNEIGVPHPTYFHPNSDADLGTWISRISASKREHLISFAGMPRDPEHIRTRLIQQCKASPAKCKFLPCPEKYCYSPEPTMKLFMTSHFCMQPPGDSATRRSVFDSLIAGCIPVLFDVDTAYFQYPWHLPSEPSSYSVYVSSEDVKQGRLDVIKLVSEISEEQRLKMRNNIMYNIVPGLLYSQPDAELAAYEDAFDITIRSLLNRVSSL